MDILRLPDAIDLIAITGLLKFGVVDRIHQFVFSTPVGSTFRARYSVQEWTSMRRSRSPSIGRASGTFRDQFGRVERNCDTTTFITYLHFRNRFILPLNCGRGDDAMVLITLVHREIGPRARQRSPGRCIT